MAPEAQWIAYGGVLIVILFLLPRGSVPARKQWYAKWRSPMAVPAVAFKPDAKEPA